MGRTNDGRGPEPDLCDPGNPQTGELAHPEPVDVAGVDELPVVARLVVEIRSDGTRNVARGALEDRASGQNVAVVADGASPLALARDLAKALVTLPSLALRRGERGERRPRPSLRRRLRRLLP